MLTLKALPNLLTLLRVFFAIFILFFLLIPVSNEGLTIFLLISFVLFVLSALFDFLDGFLARLLKAESLFGQALDPIADKILITATLLALIARSESFTLSLLILPASLIILRDLFIAGFREFLALNQNILPVSPLAKWKTSVEMMALSLILGFLLSHALTGKALLSPLSQILKQSGLVLIWLAAFLSLITAGQYLISAQRLLNHTADKTKNKDV